MGKTVTNLITVLGVGIVAFAGYYVYSQKIATEAEFIASGQDMENILNETNVFIERSKILSRVDLDISFFEDERLLSLQSFRTPVEDLPVGRHNPFEEIVFISNNDVTGI